MKVKKIDAKPEDYQVPPNDKNDQDVDDPKWGKIHQFQAGNGRALTFYVTPDFGGTLQIKIHRDDDTHPDGILSDVQLCTAGEEAQITFPADTDSAESKSRRVADSDCWICYHLGTGPDETTGAFTATVYGTTALLRPAARALEIELEPQFHYRTKR